MRKRIFLAAALAAAGTGWTAPNAATRARLAAFLAEGEDALAERLVMYWNTHATDVYVRDEAVTGVGGARADVPTVAFNGQRGHVTLFARPRVEDRPRRSEDPRGLFLAPRDGGDAQWVPYGQTGSIIDSLNREILGLARDAAELEEEPYRRLAFRVLDTYLAGILARNVPTDLNHGHLQTLFGLQSMETIHDDVLTSACATYARLKPWIAAHHPDRKAPLEAALKKWAEVQIANGVADNNWDIMQLNFILDVALVLDDDAAYADGKGREHYIDVVMNRSSIRNLSVRDLCAKGFDPATGIWFECPGYSIVTLKDLAKLADRLERHVGIDLFAEVPVLRRAFPAAREYLFPDNMLIGFGDTHPSALPKEVAAHAGDAAPAPFFYAPNASWLVARSGMDATNDVAFALNASLGNHQHANGISLELYAKGYRLAPDAGVGWSLYSGDDYKEYYSRFPAHNTVMVNSRSDYVPMKCFHPFTLVAHGDSWATVRFREPATGAEQLRTTAYVKHADGTAYFVDAFRSRVGDGAPEWHDYYYHNFGDTLTLDGTLAPTEEIAFVESGVYALSYIKEKFARAGERDVKARFDWARPEGTVTMTVFMNGAADRTFIRGLAPATEGLSRVKNPDYGITRDSRTPVLVARQRGEAWTRPFLAVMDPSGRVAAVAFAADGETVTVALADGRRDVIRLPAGAPDFSGVAP